MTDPSPPPEVAVVGSVNVDLVVAVPHRPAAGETVRGSDLVTSPGGKGANQAVAAARLGGRVAMVARVGDDAAGRVAREALLAAGVDGTDVVALPGVPTGTALVTVTPDGENAIVVAPGANAHLSAADVEAAAPRWARAAVVTLQLEVSLPAVVRAVELAAAAGRRVVLNAAPAATLPDRVVHVLDPLVVNRAEAAALLDPGRPPPGGTAEQGLAWARRLCASGARSAVVTLGGAGAAYAGSGGGGPGGAGVVGAPAVTPVDTTGAGDAFVGALSLALARGSGLDEACRYGVRAGSAAVLTAGAQAPLVTGPGGVP